MGELFPLLAGVLAGVIALRLSTAQARAASLVAMGVVFGVIATVVNGESALLVPVDAAIVVLAGLAIIAAPRVVAWLRARAADSEATAPEKRAS